MIKRLNEIEERKVALRKEIEAATEERLKEINVEADALLTEEIEIRKKLDIEGRLKAPVAKQNEILPNEKTETQMRAKQLRETRSITMSTGKLIKPMGNQTNVNDNMNAVSSIVDMVHAIPCEGMSEYQVAYSTTDMEADGTAEGVDTKLSDPGFAYASIKPSTISTYTEVSRETMKLSDVDYYNAVVAAARKALRKKVASLIIKSGTGDTANFIGFDKAEAISASLVSISKIDEKTLRTIALNYGGDDEIEGNAVLFLAKEDLISFGDIRGTNDKNAVYEITPDSSNPNAGIIKDGGLSVKYCLNKTLKPFASATVGTDLVMAYGNPLNYELGIFSDYTVTISTEAAFKKRMLAVLGEVMIGGNVVVKDGFKRIVKSSAV